MFQSQRGVDPGFRHIAHFVIGERKTALPDLENRMKGVQFPSLRIDERIYRLFPFPVFGKDIHRNNFV